MDRGTYVEIDGRPAVRFQRSYDHPVERLWTAITDPDELPHWFPSKVAMKAEVGGAIEFTDDPNAEPRYGTILVYQPPTKLAYTWGENELRFELEPIGDNRCQLTLFDVLPAQDVAARNAAGWTVCLAELDKHVAGEVTGGPHSETAEPWREHYDGFVASGMPSGAPIPDGR
ncbi:MAG TPA: SRPBCC family protein [Streptosporangiaceae bacterium]|nr:SRPBCC family protein [Streptosporangiaceae bacterium]